jgi:hypothetical protein
MPCLTSFCTRRTGTVRYSATALAFSHRADTSAVLWEVIHNKSVRFCMPAELIGCWKSDYDHGLMLTIIAMLVSDRLSRLQHHFRRDPKGRGVRRNRIRHNHRSHACQTIAGNGICIVGEAVSWIIRVDSPARATAATNLPNAPKDRRREQSPDCRRRNVSDALRCFVRREPILAQ